MPRDEANADGPRVSAWGYLTPYKGRLVIGAVMLVATNFLFLAEPVLLGRIVDALRQEGQTEQSVFGPLFEMLYGADPAGQVATLALLMVVFAVGTAITRIGSRIAIFDTARDAEYDLRGALFGHLLRFEPAFYRKNPTGDIMSRLVNDVQTVRAMWGPGVLNIVNTGVVFATVLTMMIRIDPMLTLWAVAPYPLMVVFGQVFGRRLYRTSRAVQIELGQLSSSIQEDLTGINIIKTYSLEDQRRSNFSGISRKLLDRNMALTTVRGLLVPIFGGLSSISMVIVLWVGGLAVIDTEISLGEFVEFTSYLARLVWPTLALGWMLSLFQRGRAAWSRLEDLLSAEPQIQDGPGPDLDDVTGHVSIRDLRIEIDGKPILNGVSFEMPAGTITAVVGRTGSGKSTLIEALPRLIDVPAGTVFLDGRDITELPLSSLRHAIGYAPQEAFLFSTTIANNIAFGYERTENNIAFGYERTEAKNGDADATAPAPASAPAVPGRGIEASGEIPVRGEDELDDRLVDAAAAAGLTRDLAALPRRYDTVVGERGITLSGGQRQRVALARALATLPRVLILDDSLSSVDAETEREILGHLSQLMKGRTAILISHRVAAVKRADQIVCLDEGRVVEVGTHDELIAAGGVYAEVYQTQLEPDDPEVGDEQGGDAR